MVFGRNISVTNSKYTACPDPNHQLAYEARRGEIFDVIDATEIDINDWVPKEAFVNSFPWDNCGISPPELKCTDPDWPRQVLAHKNVRKNVNNPEQILYETLYGACYPDEGFRALDD